MDCTRVGWSSSRWRTDFVGTPVLWNGTSDRGHGGRSICLARKPILCKVNALHVLVDRGHGGWSISLVGICRGDNVGDDEKLVIGGVEDEMLSYQSWITWEL